MKLLKRNLVVIESVSRNLRGDRRSGWFIFLSFLIAIVRHITCATFTGPDGVGGICGDISGFSKKLRPLCASLILVDLYTYLFVYPEGRRTEIGDRDVVGTRAEGVIRKSGM